MSTHEVWVVIHVSSFAIFILGFALASSLCIGLCTLLLRLRNSHGGRRGTAAVQGWWVCLIPAQSLDLLEAQALSALPHKHCPTNIACIARLHWAVGFRVAVGVWHLLHQVFNCYTHSQSAVHCPVLQW